MSDIIREALFALADRIEEANGKPIGVDTTAAYALRAAITLHPAPAAPVAFFWEDTDPRVEGRRYGPYFGWPTEEALARVGDSAKPIPLYTATPAAEQPDTVKVSREVLDDDALEMMAREILAQEYERIGIEGRYPTYAEAARNGAGEFTMRSIRAIKRALLSGGVK